MVTQSDRYIYIIYDRLDRYVGMINRYVGIELLWQLRFGSEMKLWPKIKVPRVNEH